MAEAKSKIPSTSKKKRYGFFDAELIGAITEWMWALIIIAALAVLMTIVLI